MKKDGTVDLKISAENGEEYLLCDKSKASTIVKKILKAIKPAKTTVSMKKGKAYTVKMKKRYAEESIKKISYSSSDKKVAKVDKNGKVLAVKKGTATVKAKVTLKDGTAKTISMKVKVK